MKILGTEHVGSRISPERPIEVAALTSQTGCTRLVVPNDVPECSTPAVGRRKSDFEQFAK
jgi:hypothetical protein